MYQILLPYKDDRLPICKVFEANPFYRIIGIIETILVTIQEKIYSFFQLSCENQLNSKSQKKCVMSFVVLWLLLTCY